ncbi:coiled-coil domain-containing protein-domain-containing protein [Parasitella parasitica]|nr:coiled-coil domain-containing protein-domain-containing protein [Parasitella parasitica]
MEFITRNIDTIPFKTLRHSEVELPPEEQLIQIQATLRKDPGLFLSKWGRYLSQNSLRLFQVIQSDYEVDFYLNSLLYNQEEHQKVQRQSHKKSAMQLVAHNRRFEFLQRKLRGSDYYSDESIQLREPVLYDHYIGQYIPAREKAKPFDNDMTLVNRIFSNMDRKFVDDFLYDQKIRDEEQFEEEDDDDEEIETEKPTPIVLTKKKSEDVEMKGSVISNDDQKEQDEEDTEDTTEAQTEFREEQRAELIRLLEEKFLDGKDDFDYEKVDYNEDYDNLQQLEQDMQDRYFDEDD